MYKHFVARNLNIWLFHSASNRKYWKQLWTSQSIEWQTKNLLAKYSKMREKKNGKGKSVVPVNVGWCEMTPKSIICLNKTTDFDCRITKTYKITLSFIKVFEARKKGPLKTTLWVSKWDPNVWKTQKSKYENKNKNQKQKPSHLQNILSA